MPVNIDLSVDGYLTPHGYGTSIERADGSQITLTASHSVIAVLDPTGDVDPVNTRVELPYPTSPADAAGIEIVIKLLTTQDINLTIGRGENPSDDNNDTVKIDGGDTDIILDQAKQTITFFYVNEEIGWLAGPATF